jgi:hypothetical protein
MNKNNIYIIYMSLDNFDTSIKLRLLSIQPRDIVDIYQDINVSDLKIGENKIPITNPQIIRILKNSTRVFNVSITTRDVLGRSITKTGEDYATTNQYLLGYDTDSSDAYSESGASADTDAYSESGASADTDGSSESGASADAYSESGASADTDGSSESGASADASSESELHTDGSSESGASAYASSDSELHTDAYSESETSMDSY